MDVLTRINMTVGRGITHVEIGNLQENFKTDILNFISSQLETLHLKQKQEEEEETLAIFFPKCRKSSPLKECPLR
jgi:hypothetical protein